MRTLERKGIATHNELIEEVKEVPEPIYIHKTGLGYDIYSMDNELILAFTSVNCDSSNLDLLEQIYEEVKDHREEKLKESPIKIDEGIKKI